ncbi:hypothetical protein NKI44_29815 [Mesorhizobium sp. M0614]|uniref:hypothetical protein n=1 Tax=Mesorhizobium sp. M0614 TaxID=2956970 RepID=UPI0033372A75
MSYDRYSDDQMSGKDSDKPMSATEKAFANMTPEQRSEFVERAQHASAKAAHDEKAAKLRAQVAAATEVSLAGNAWYQQQQRGTLSQRVSISNGVTKVEQLNAPAPESASSAFAVPPRALVDTIPVTVGGIQLGPKQAREMYERGEISANDYGAGLDEALRPYGYRFR